MIDNLDKKIINILGRHGRINNKNIASQLSVSEGTIRNRIRKLTDSGVLTVSGLINPDTVDDKQLVFLGIKISSSKDLEKKAAEVSELYKVQSACITSGRYDIIIEVWVDLRHGLIDFLSKQLTRINGIESTESFVVLKNYNKLVVDK
ncbi:MAG: Lrp/AsnC family transcriptional regulator [Desulfobulbaceae bacterium]|nr:Lrp/AsnC family transcriptional regulator [Desulfobulbaceae bacterium]